MLPSVVQNKQVKSMCLTYIWTGQTSLLTGEDAKIIQTRVAGLKHNFKYVFEVRFPLVSLQFEQTLLLSNLSFTCSQFSVIHWTTFDNKKERTRCCFGVANYYLRPKYPDEFNLRCLSQQIAQSSNLYALFYFTRTYHSLIPTNTTKRIIFWSILSTRPLWKDSFSMDAVCNV